MEAKIKEEAEKQRLAEEKEKKKWIEYLQKLWDEVLVEDIILLGDMEGSQVARTKHKKITSKDKEEQWPSKKNKRKQPAKYYGDAGVKIGCINLCGRCVYARQDCLVHNSKWVKNFFLFFLY